MKVKKISKILFAAGVAIALALTFFVGGLAINYKNSKPVEQVSAAIRDDVLGRTSGTGTGTQLDPYIIGTAAHLQSMLNSYAATPNKLFILVNDITMTGTGNFTPVAKLATGSVLDGNGFSITGMHINGGGTSRAMFLNYHGWVKNLTFNNFTVTGASNFVSFIAADVSDAMAANLEFGVDNVKIENGNLSGASRTGGFLGATTASGASNTTRANFNVLNSYIKATINGGNSCGGFFGYINNNYMNITVKNSFYQGDLKGNSNLVGGIIGAPYMNSQNTLIENCFVKGSVTGNGTMTGGIFGGKSGSSIITLRNCFVDATITTLQPANANSVSGLGSLFSTTDVIIQNCYFNSTKFSGPATVTNSGGLEPITPQNPDGRSVKQPGVMIETPTFIDWLNNGQNPPVWVWTPVGPELSSHSLFTNTVVVLDANGGQFAGDESSVEIRFGAGEDWTNVTVPAEPTRAGYNFNGYNSLANGTGIPYALATDVPYDGQTTVYAQWTKTTYMVDIVGDKTGGQVVMFFDDAANAFTNSIKIDQQGYIWTYLGTEEDDVFSSFMILKKEAWNGGTFTNDSANWVNIGAGESYVYTNTYKGQRLFFDDLIDEDFITNYAIDDNGTQRLVFKAVYDQFSPNQITVTTSLPVLGSLKIDGLSRPYGISMNYPSSHAEQVEIVATPIAYRKFVRFDIFVGGTFVESRTTSTILITIVDGMTIEAVFANQEYDVRLISQSGVTTLSTQTTVGGIELSSGYTSGQLLEHIADPFSPATARHRIVSNNVSNYKIFNKMTGRYDYFNAGNRTVSINDATVNEDFFEKYLSLDGNFDIIVEYVRQFKFDFAITNGQRGNVTMTITSPYGGSYPVNVGESNASLEPYYDDGSLFTITCLPNVDSRLADMSTLQPGELTGRVITLYLTSARNIVVAFEAADFTFSYHAYNNFGEIILDGAEAEVTPSTTGQIALDQTISVSKTNSSDYSFVGWYTLVRGEFRFYSYGNPGDSYNLPALTFNTAFIRDYADGYNVVLVAMFAKIFSVEVIVTDNTIGDFSIEVYTDIGGVWSWESATLQPQYDANTLIKINALPSDFYKLSFIDGLDIATSINVGGNMLQIEEVNYAENYVIIRVDGLRVITLDFETQKYTIVDTNNDLSKAKGSVNANKTEIGLGDTVVLTFKASGGYQLSSWSVNNQDLATTNKRGDTLSFTVTDAWLRQNVDLLNNTVTLFSTISTTMNQTYMIALFTTLGAVPVLTIALLTMFIMNRKKKAQYKAALERSKKMEFGLNQQEFLKNIKGE